MKTSKNIIKVKLKEKIIVEAVREKGGRVWEGKKKESLVNEYCTNVWNEHSPEGPSEGHIMENPMSVGLLTFPQRRDFHDLLGQRQSLSLWYWDGISRY
jgi:hypothetical protein